ncbi:MAG: UDP-N-acetylmuramoyl-L-alanine--D-glutamate ligase [Lachnospiraceae bacterium]|nr:UDP-N-acetylmuramoyl-L-alanine--D-glutamate ligase [Lachnospiraceae bacterium]MDY5742747.1 UDP-N-acetylmuramoyl-L-alanine--D-glutamate ligase [Lachnospiraceae bacterium]
MDMRAMKVLVIGCGVSGIGAGRALHKKGAAVYLFDANYALKVQELYDRIDFTPKNIYLGMMTDEQLSEMQLVIVSPGVPMEETIICQARGLGLPIWGEVELAYRLGKGHILAITGTNGKTTTTALLGEIMQATGADTHVVGNIGLSYTGEANHLQEASVVVAELSSFQLETIVQFRPQISAILNITPDHLNRHHTMEEYIRVKERIAENQQPEDYCILNYEDEVLRKFGQQLQCRVLYFSSWRILEEGVYIEDETLRLKLDKKTIDICRLDELKLFGRHNYENYMVAIGMAVAYGVDLEVLRTALKQFGGVAHRIEFVKEVAGVVYYNDSKGTNPDAAIKAVEAMVRPTILIGGGYDKDADFEEWIRSFNGKVKHLVLLGQTKEKIRAQAVALGYQSITLVDQLEEAVSTAHSLANEGDAVLLSPACASWGMFQNYEERGDRFKELVRLL